MPSWRRSSNPYNSSVMRVVAQRPLRNPWVRPLRSAPAPPRRHRFGSPRSSSPSPAQLNVDRSPVRDDRRGTRFCVPEDSALSCFLLGAESRGAHHGAPRPLPRRGARAAAAGGDGASDRDASASGDARPRRCLALRRSGPGGRTVGPALPQRSSAPRRRCRVSARGARGPSPESPRAGPRGASPGAARAWCH